MQFIYSLASVIAIFTDCGIRVFNCIHKLIAKLVASLFHYENVPSSRIVRKCNKNRLFISLVFIDNSPKFNIYVLFLNNHSICNKCANIYMCFEHIRGSNVHGDSFFSCCCQLRRSTGQVKSEWQMKKKKKESDGRVSSVLVRSSVKGEMILPGVDGEMHPKKI